MTACHVAIAIGGSWHGKRARLLILEAGVKTQSGNKPDFRFLLYLKSSDVLLHINDRPHGLVLKCNRMTQGKSSGVLQPSLRIRKHQLSTL